jgi:NADH-quinone oxidoreductase subunit C
MTTLLTMPEINKIISGSFPEAISAVTPGEVIIRSEYLLGVAEYLKTEPGLAFDYLNYIVATDYYDYLELVYQLTSLKNNRSLVFKVRCFDRVNPSVPSITGIWRGADFQEREIYDLLGITFNGHPNLRRIFLWDGFQGYPLRKDYL